MTLYLIGLGLGNEKSITLEGLEAIKKCDKLYLETYTSKLQCTKKDLERLYNKKVTEVSREFVEDGKQILKEAKTNNIGLLIIGDPLSATTHINFLIEAKKVKIIHNSSILSAVAKTGLFLYKFGKTASIPFDNKNIETPYKILKQNQKDKAHTLFLLDLKDNKFMAIKEALEYLLKKGMKNKLCVGCAALGSDREEIKSDKAKDLIKSQFKNFPQCLIVPGKLHFKEEEALKLWKL